LLRNVANACRDDERRKHVAESAGHLGDALDQDAPAHAREMVEDMGR
jgi:hypothetical protein